MSRQGGAGEADGGRRLPQLGALLRRRGAPLARRERAEQDGDEGQAPACEKERRHVAGVEEGCAGGAHGSDGDHQLCPGPERGACHAQRGQLGQLRLGA
jgi:hypothetical protein